MELVNCNISAIIVVLCKLTANCDDSAYNMLVCYC